MKPMFLRVALALVGLLAFVASATAEPAKMPTLSIKTLDGGTFDLSAERGKWVIVNFWATWCSPCIKEMPDISKFVASRSDVAAIGLAFGGEEIADVT
ncbi:MAG TPA: TlpA disulfide reductase family protein, partial [Rhodanobacteraceae bacterium]|nr:TlpA disulfide reductase family protein [Rhodanobacteraceae bacterium]